MRLPNGFGSVYKLSGNRRNPWVARKTVGWTLDQEKGKSNPVYRFIGYYPSRKDALTALAEYNKDPYDLQTPNLTFEDVFERWSEQHFKKVSESNIKGYKASFRTCSALHKMKFVDIKLDHLQKVVDESGKNTPTLKKMKNMFNQMWEYAVIHEIITPDRREMVKYVDISKAGNPNKIDRQPFTKKQIDLIWKLTPSNDYMEIILILIYSGVRISELLDLKKEDVHLQERWFYVRESKTEAGVREIPIADKIVPYVDKWIRKKSDWLVCTPEGKHFTYRNYYDSYWTPMMNILGEGFENHRPHDTRHTCVSMLTSAGVDERIIKKIVGHKGQGVTETVYTHLELPIKLEAINKI